MLFENWKKKQKQNNKYKIGNEHIDNVKQRRRASNETTRPFGST